MMLHVGAAEAKTLLSQLLEQVAQGEEIVITKHGLPVAVLTPPPTCRHKDPKTVIAALQAGRRGRRLEGLSVRQLIDASR